MGFFDKKYCDVCGEKIGLLGNRKLEDGNLCKECAKKLSPFFDERRHSTVAQIKEQLAYREQNERVLQSFRATKTFGENVHLYVDETKGQFVVANNINDGRNHDVINLSQITGCSVDIKENRTEEYRKDSEGKSVSYVPPRYKYSYDYNVILTVNAPYFDDIKIDMHTFSIGQHETARRNKIENECRQILSYISSVTGVAGNMAGMSGMGMNQMGMSGMGMNQQYGNQMGMNPQYGNQMGMNPQYRNQMGMNQQYGNQMGMNQQYGNQMGMNQQYGNQMGMNQQYGNQMGMNPQYGNQMGINQQYGNQMGMNQQYGNQMGMNQQANQMNQSAEWVCPECSATNKGRFCEFCGSPRK